MDQFTIEWTDLNNSMCDVKAKITSGSILNKTYRLTLLKDLAFKSETDCQNFNFLFVPFISLGPPPLYKDIFISQFEKKLFYFDFSDLDNVFFGINEEINAEEFYWVPNFKYEDEHNALNVNWNVQTTSVYLNSVKYEFN